MIPRTFIAAIRSRWQSTPSILRYNGGTLIVAGFLAAAVHAISAGPSASRADLAPPVAAIEHLPAAADLKSTTQPAIRNLFSLDWQRDAKPSAAPTTAPDDPGFWNDVATPLKKKPAGGVR